MNLRASLLSLVASPDRAWYTLLIGILLIIRELTAPGRVLPGVLGGVAAVSAAHALIGYGVTPEGLALIGLGAALSVLQGFRDWWYAPAISSAIVTTVGVRQMMAGAGRLSWTAAAAGGAVTVIAAMLLRVAVRAHKNKVSTVE